MDNDSLWSLHKDSSIHNKMAFVVTIALIDGVVVLGAAAHVIFLRPHADIFWGERRERGLFSFLDVGVGRICLLAGYRLDGPPPGLQGSSSFTLCHSTGFVTLHDLSSSGLAGFVALQAVSPCKAKSRAPRQQKVLTSVEGWPRGVLQSLITKPVIRTSLIFTDDRFCLLTCFTSVE